MTCDDEEEERERAEGVREEEREESDRVQCIDKKDMIKIRQRKKKRTRENLDIFSLWRSCSVAPSFVR